MSDGIDRLIRWLKWPVAVLAVAFLPGAIMALARLLVRVATHPWPVAMFLIGFALYSVVWWWYFRRTRFAYFLTLEHELTHALFAIATGHRVTGLRATAFRGGHVQFIGTGNWLITIAPYFFPTLSVFVMIVTWPLPGSLASLASIVVGGSFAYHVTSSLREIHPRQTDLQQAGVMFCVAFLPTANILTFGTLLAFIYGGWQGSAQFVGAIWHGTWEIVTY